MFERSKGGMVPTSAIRRGRHDQCNLAAVTVLVVTEACGTLFVVMFAGISVDRWAVV